MEKVLQISKISLLVIVLLCSGCKVFYNQFYTKKSPAITTNVYSKYIVWTPIKWTKGEYSDRNALYIPIKVDSISNKFYAQFDLGIQRSRITSLNKGFPYLEKYTVEKKYKNLPIYLGKDEKYTFNESVVIDYDLSKPEDFVAKDTASFVKIGDIGYDYIKGRILVTDFMNSRYALTDELPKDFESRVSWINSPNVRANKWSIHIPVKINEKERTYFYDNGSSQFTLFVPKSDWDTITNEGKNSTVDSLLLSSWGKNYYYMRGKPAQKITDMFGEDLSAKKIFYGGQMNARLFKLMNYFEGVEGIIGNEYFRDKVLVIDTKLNRIGFYK